MTGRALLLAGAGVGAGIVYLFDPQAGRRRRALARDKVQSAFAKGQDAFDVTRRDMANRARGLVAEGRAAVRRESPPSDDVLAERVREKLGHYASHPGSIAVTVVGGCVLLEGPVLASEVDRLVRAAARVRGVRDVESRLAVHRTPGDVPGLQGGVA